MASVEGVVENIEAGNKEYREQVIPRADASRRVLEDMSTQGLEEHYPVVQQALADMFRGMRERVQETGGDAVLDHADTANDYYTRAVGGDGDLSPELITTALGGALSTSAYATHHAAQLHEVVGKTLVTIDDTEKAVLDALRRGLDDIAVSANVGMVIAESLQEHAVRATSEADDYISSIT